MMKIYNSWPTKSAVIGLMTATVPDMGDVVLGVGEKSELHGDVLHLTMAEAKFPGLPVEWTEA